MLTYIALLLLVTFTVALYALYKVRNMHVMLYGIKEQFAPVADNLFRQMEALHGLYRDLELQKSLPPTRGWAASPDFLQEIARYALGEKPRMVVECSSGASTVVLARCMQMNGAGKVYSLEHDAHFAGETRRNLERHGLTEWAEVLDAPLRPFLTKRGEFPWYAEDSVPDGRIDMLVIDGPPGHLRPLARYPAGPVLFPRLAEHAAVFMDDAARSDETAILAYWRMEFPELAPPRAVTGCEKGCAVLRKHV